MINILIVYNHFLWRKGMKTCTKYINDFHINQNDKKFNSSLSYHFLWRKGMKTCTQYINDFHINLNDKKFNSSLSYHLYEEKA